MSYRNPKIITPPNYGEIFARNMQYGASMVQSALQPVMSALEEQKRTKDRMASSRLQFEENIRKMITTKAGSFEKMFEEHLQKNGDAWYENMRLYENGERSAKEYNDFMSNMMQEIYDAAAASENLNKTITYIETNKMLLSKRNDHEIFGLKEAMENPNDFNFQMTRDEDGKTVFKYTGNDGKEVVFDYDRIKSIRAEEDIILQNDYTSEGAMRQQMDEMTKQALLNTPAQVSKDTTDISYDVKNKSKTVRPVQKLKNKEDIKNAYVAYLAQNPNAFTTNQIEAHYLDSMCGEDYEACIKRKAATIANKFNITDVEALSEMLLTPFKEGQVIKDMNGEEITISKIAYDMAEQDIIDRAISSSVLRQYFEGDGEVALPEEILPWSPPSPDDDVLDRNKELNTLFRNSFTFLSNAGVANVLASKDKPLDEVDLADVYKINLGDSKAINDYIQPMGFELEETTASQDGQKKTGPRIKTDANGKDYYVMVTNKDAVGAEISKTAKKEFRINEDTTIFDLLSYRLQLQDVHIDPKKLKEIYDQGEDEYIAYLSAQFMGGSYKGYNYNPTN